jgi:hypothetical protein
MNCHKTGDTSGNAVPQLVAPAAISLVYEDLGERTLEPGRTEWVPLTRHDVGHRELYAIELDLP